MIDCKNKALVLVAVTVSALLSSQLLLLADLSSSASRGVQTLTQPTISRHPGRRAPPTGTLPIITKAHKIYKGWQQPIVFEEYKLAFFRIPKVAQTTFLQLFLRMMDVPVWNTTDTSIVHQIAKPLIGPRLLGKFPLRKAQEIMTSSNYNRAVFIRDPLERLLSAYLDRVDPAVVPHAAKVCCKQWLSPDTFHWNQTLKEWNHCARDVSKQSVSLDNISSTCNNPNFQVSKEGVQCISGFYTFEHFVARTLRACSDPHWSHQSRLLNADLWPYVNFIGRLDTAAEDVERLLRSLGNEVWERYGADGWGVHGNESMFQSLSALSHSRSAKSKYYKYYDTTELEAKARAWYAEDYSHPVLGEFLNQSMDKAR